MKNWLRRTHGPSFELLRHFLRRFFESDLVATPGQMITVLVGAFPVAFQWFFLLIGPLRQKYGALSRLPGPELYREAVRADELWLITLMMSVIGLLTAIKWSSLFPDLADYRTLGSLPLRARHVFGAKLAALLLIAAAALIAVNFLPGFGFPALSASRWAIQPSIGARIQAHLVAALAGCAFFFFALIAIQGVLLNVLAPRTFGRVTGTLQGLLVAIMLGSIVLSFSIQPQITATLLDSQWTRWLPPLWFLGLHQTLAGDPDPLMRSLANRASAALTIAVVVALVTYLICYRRHRTLAMEGAAARRKASPASRWMPLASDPRRQAILTFMAGVIARSSHHRMILMGYGGLGFAALLTALIGVTESMQGLRALVSGFLYFHLIALAVLLLGARHLFAIPIELKANWIFQITERQGRIAWLLAVDRFVLLSGAVIMLAPAPAAWYALGPRGLAELALVLAPSTFAYHAVFFAWRKLPFGCSHLPAKTPMWLKVVQFFGLLGAVQVLHTILLAAMFDVRIFAGVLALALVASVVIIRRRRQSWTELPLKYEEVPEPAVHALNLLR